MTVHIFNRNSLINLFLISFSILLAYLYSPLFLLTWPLVLFADDFFYYTFDKSLFDTEIRVQAGYQFAHIFLSGISNEGRDLGFNLYDHDVTKPKEKAQQDKWDFMLNHLELKEGDWLIDIGCGYGDWLNYARSKGINCVGVNISPEQTAAARETFNLDVICSNWKDIEKSSELKGKLFDKFDAVTFMDTVEHYVPMKYRHNIPEQGKIYTKMFELAHLLLKKGQKKRVFISCLHCIKHQGLKNVLSIYLLDKYHCGYYPFGDNGLACWAEPYFKELARFDRTEDYRLTSALDQRHFGAPKVSLTVSKIFFIPLLFLTDPHHIHKWIDIYLDTWMVWHFGKDAYNKDYNNEYQKKMRNVTLWWLVLESK